MGNLQQRIRWCRIGSNNGIEEDDDSAIYKNINQLTKNFEIIISIPWAIKLYYTESGCIGRHKKIWDKWEIYKALCTDYWSQRVNNSFLSMILNEAYLLYKDTYRQVKVLKLCFLRILPAKWLIIKFYGVGTKTRASRKQQTNLNEIKDSDPICVLIKDPKDNGLRVKQKITDSTIVKL